jgi:alpha-1,6-mannosyltransferase
VTLWAAFALGLAGALLAALAAPRALDHPVVGWWYGGIAAGRALATVLVWIGMGALALAWLVIALVVDGRSAPPSARELTLGRALTIGGIWMLPLALAPPLFSRDVYSYLAQGTILHLGDDPYRQAPVVLAGLGHRHLLAAVSPFWRHTTAPYGPLFLELVSLIVGICGSHLIAGVLLCRALDLIGLALIAVHVPRLARALGTDPTRAVWRAGASPLVTLGLIAAAHNDLLMVGLLTAGVAYALRGHPLLGVAVCALAATIKLPALVGAVFIAVCWARAERRGGERALIVGASAAIVAGVLGIVTLASGVGVGWLSASVFSTPARVRLAITPARAVGETIAVIARAAGASMSGRGLESALGIAAAVVAACIGAWLLRRARVPTVVGLLGVTLLLAAVGGPAAWPWYLTWGLVLLCACAAPQRSLVLLAVLTVGPFLVAPDGILVLPLPSAPAVLAVYLAAAAAWARWGRARTPMTSSVVAIGT